MTRFACLTFALLLPSIVHSHELVSVCYSQGTETDGVTGFTHFTNGRAVRVDSPWPNDSRSRVTVWQDDGFAQKLYERLVPRWSTMPEDALDQCDQGWRDTIVLHFDDGTRAVREGSCIRNPVAETLQVVFVGLASVAENSTVTYTEGAIDGAYSPCFHDW